MNVAAHRSRSAPASFSNVGRLIRHLRIGSRPATGVLLCCVSLYAASAARAQVPDRGTATGAKVNPTVSILDVVHAAVRSYPSVQVSREDLNAAQANILLARTAYLPRLDGLAQFNRATRNNVFGALLPQSTLPAISGPVIGSNNGGSVWGSATGVLINWQPFDFGFRRANVQAARAAHEKADAALQLSQLDVGTAAADSFLTLIAARQTAKAAAAAVDTWEILVRVTHALTASGLRPGADESRAQAELAMVRNQLVYAQQAEENGTAVLSKFLSGSDDVGATLNSARMLDSLPTADDDPTLHSDRHPLAAEQRAATAQASAQLHATERSWVPQVALEGSAYSRGTGANTDGGRLTGTGGLVPDVQNYALGVNLTFPFMDFASIHAREAVQAAALRASKDTELLTDRNLREQFAKSRAALHAARQIARNTPAELDAAHAAFDQARARYQTGLSQIDDLAQAQRLVVQAEVDDAIARLNVWRAFLQLSAAQGDIQPFLEQASK